MLSSIMREAKKIEFEEIPVPEVGANQVLIEVKRIGICGSDIHVFHGRHKYMTFPVVQGHEGSGVITKVGQGVTDFSVGDKVTLQPNVSCGTCLLCKERRNNVCEQTKVLGVHGTGLGSQYFLANADMVHKLPDNVGFDEGAMVEPIAVAVHAVRKYGNIQGKKAVVLGGGPIGNLVAQVAKALGADKVMITDINPIRLEKAKKCGVDYCINTKEEDLDSAILSKFGPDRADVIFDCAAVKATMEQSIKSARRGSKIVVVGNFNDPVTIEMPLLQRREIDLVGIMLYENKNYEEAIKLLAEGKIATGELITNYFNFREFQKAYEYIDSNAASVMKVIIKVDE